MCQPFESAAISLVKENDIKPQEIEFIKVYCGTKAYAIAAAPEKRIPQNAIHAQFSTYYKIASAVARRESTVAQYTEQAVRDSIVLDLCKRIEIQLSPEYDDGLAKGRSGRLLIKTNRKNGAFFANAGTFKGHPDNPMTWEDLIVKMKSCASSSVRAISETKLATLCEMVKNLEKVQNCVEIIKFMIA
jgi:2-methylcitrate dehydratase